MEEKLEKKLNSLTAIVVILLIVVLGLGGFVAYKELIKKDDNNSNTNTTEPTNTKKQYDKITLTTETGQSEYIKKIVINGKVTGTECTDVDVLGQIDDVLVAKVWNLDFFNVYAFDKDGNLKTLFSADSGLYTPELKIVYVGGILDVKLDGNSLVFDSMAYYTQDAHNFVCSVGDTDIVEYKKKTTYKDGEFSDLVTLSETTAKEYKTQNNVTCE